MTGKNHIHVCSPRLTIEDNEDWFHAITNDDPETIARILEDKAR